IGDGSLAPLRERLQRQPANVAGATTARRRRKAGERIGPLGRTKCPPQKPPIVLPHSTASPSARFGVTALRDTNGPIRGEPNRAGRGGGTRTIRRGAERLSQPVTWPALQPREEGAGRT